jgi:hypothetical protein
MVCVCVPVRDQCVSRKERKRVHIFEEMIAHVSGVWLEMLESIQPRITQKLQTFEAIRTVHSTDVYLRIDSSDLQNQEDMRDRTRVERGSSSFRELTLVIFGGHRITPQLVMATPSKSIGLVAME